MHEPGWRRTKAAPPRCTNKLARPVSPEAATTFNGTGVLAPSTTSFDNAIGWVLQADWLPYDSLSVYVRYTFIDYSPTGSSANIPGGGVGFGVSWLPRFK
jgi:hypothetical protein